MPQSIIDVANATFSTMAQQQQEQQSAATAASSSSSQGQQQTLQPDLSSSYGSNGNTMNLDDRLDAARAILGISPHSVIDTNSMQQAAPSSYSSSSSMKASQPVSADRPLLPQSNNGLDALAFLASKEQEHSVPLHSGVAAAGRSQANHNSRSTRNMTGGHTSTVSSSCSSSDNDDEFGNNTMPPPPPRDPPSAIQSIQTQRQYITTRRLGRPRSVSAPEGMEKWTPRSAGRLQLVLPAAILEEELAEASAAMEAKEAELGRRASEESCHDDSGDWEQGRPSIETSFQRHNQNGLLIIDEPADEEDEEEEDDNEEDVEPSELLRRARSRLLEDLSEGNLNGEKGVFTAPHTLAKYKEVYNRNGRIGIYTPAERSAIIARFQEKRTKRVWNKKIRYNCRKNLADRRLRVKGRFVKRSADTVEAAEAANSGKTETVADSDTEMPDVSDPNAGFAPTEDQPYRRLRRHTIT
mmetsp:Transcript_14718/g.35967  ORF Transcript_14718/g.35967 Transcript_14718/m.35967 type:complete len:468 (-) Transcript_14718:3212-4615(-)